MPAAPLHDPADASAVSRCTLAPHGGVSLGAHVDGATIAALGENALVTATEHPPEQEGEMHSTTLFEARLSAEAMLAGHSAPASVVPSGLVPHPNDVLTHRGVALGDGDMLLAAAVSSNDIMIPGWAQRAVVDLAPVSRPLRSHAIREPFSAEALAGAARHGLVVLAATANESLHDSENLPEPGPPRLFVVTAGASGTTVTGSPLTRDTELRAPAVALASDDHEGGAVAYVAGPDSLRVWRLDERGVPAGVPREITHGDGGAEANGVDPPPRLIGAPTIAFRGRTLVVVWAQRTNATAPFSLRSLTFDPNSDAQLPAVEVLTSGNASTFAPAVVTRGNRVVLAWMEGDESHGRIRAGVGDTVAQAVASAAVVSDPSVDARDPELAVSDTRTWIVWQEFRDRHRIAQLRAGLLECW